MDRLLDEDDATLFRESIAQMQDDFATFLYRDTFTCWRVSRSGTWQDTTEAEARGIVGMGTGKLYENGVGGPIGSEAMIHIESPYRFRTRATADIQNGDRLVLNGTRVFRVDVGKEEHREDVLMNVYLSEITGDVEVPTTW